MYYVYVYKHPVTNIPFYVGKGSGGRAYTHLRETKERTENYLKWCKIKSLQSTNTAPVIEMVFESEDEDACYDEEARLIVQYGRIGFDVDGVLTNRCIDNRPPTYAANMPRSSVYRKHMSESKSGSKNPMYGKTPWNKDKAWDDETKHKIGNANRGRKYTIDEIEKRNKTRGKVYEICDPNGNKTVVINLKNWCTERGLCAISLSLVCRGKKNSYRGYTGTLLGNQSEFNSRIKSNATRVVDRRLSRSDENDDRKLCR